MDRKLLVAWAAGFLEADGSFYATVRKRVRKDRGGKIQLQGSWVIKAQNCDLESLQRLKQIFGGSICGPYDGRSHGHKPYWIWTLHGQKKTRDALMEMWDWLSPRRQHQASRIYLDRKDL